MTNFDGTTWLPTTEVTAWLTEQRRKTNPDAKAASTDSVRQWAARYYQGEVRKGEAKPGRVAPNLYQLAELEAGLARMTGRGGPGKARGPRNRLAKLTPAEVDTEAAPIWAELNKALSRMWTARTKAGKATRADSRARYEHDAVRWSDAADVIRERLAPFDAEYDRRGGWTRAYEVTNADGHIHRTTACKTCRWNTEFRWLYEVSDWDMDKIIDAAGEMACTVCYPDAPVSERPAQIGSSVERRAEKAARDAERAEKRAAKAAKAITNPDGSPLRDSLNMVVATEVSAVREYMTAMTDARWYPGQSAEYREVAERMLAALAHKRGVTVDTVRAELAPKVEAKWKRDNR